MTIGEWLSGMVDFNLSEKTISAICFNRNVSADADAAVVGLRARELCLADVLMFLVTSSKNNSDEYVSDGGWQHKLATKNVEERAALQARAARLYRKWGCTEGIEDASSGMINIKAIY